MKLSQLPSVSLPPVHSVCCVSTLHHLHSRIPTIDARNDRPAIGRKYFGPLVRSSTRLGWLFLAKRKMRPREKIISTPADGGRRDIYLGMSSYGNLQSLLPLPLLAAFKDVTQRPHSSCRLPAGWCSRRSGCNQTRQWSSHQSRICNV